MRGNTKPRRNQWIAVMGGLLLALLLPLLLPPVAVAGGLLLLFVLLLSPPDTRSSSAAVSSRAICFSLVRPHWADAICASSTVASMKIIDLCGWRSDDPT